MEQPLLHLSHEGYSPRAADTGARAPIRQRDAARSAPMHDFFPAFHPPERPRRRVVPVPGNLPAARARPAMRAALAVQAAAHHVQACARGDIACRAAWLHVQALGPDGVLALPRAKGIRVSDAGAMPSLAALAGDVEHTLASGIKAGSARALLLLAALAEVRFKGGDAARAIAAAAVTLAAKDAEHDAVQRLHTALVLARHVPFAACLAGAGAPPAGDLTALLAWSGMCFGAGAPLPDILRGLEQAPGAALHAGAGEGAARVALLRALVAPRQDAAIPVKPGASFATWTQHLQLAWFNGDRAGACRAALAAGPLAGPLALPADLLAYHLFAALALAWDASPQHRHALHWHRCELDEAASRCPANAGAMAALIGAVALAGAGDVPGALSGYEAAAACAAGHGQAWVAALAWELAAALCQQYAFGAAMPAYRRRALMAWHACGANGRIARLCQGWNEDGARGYEAVERDAPPGRAASDDLQDPDESRRVARAGMVGELGVSIAHEVNQPLAAILLQAAAARRWLRRPTPDLDKALDAIEQIAVSGRRAGDIVRSVQGLARRDASGLTTFPVDAALEEVLRLLGRTLRKHAVRADLALQLAGCQVHGNRAQVQQVVINLLQNAIDALATVEGRAREIVLSSRRLAADTIEICVADNGPGVAPDHCEQIFQALFSTKANGTGVGLSISRAIAEAHGGHIEYRPRTPHGALFSLVLAAVPEGAG
jgi:signal transduction histidine kinase